MKRVPLLMLIGWTLRPAIGILVMRVRPAEEKNVYALFYQNITEAEIVYDIDANKILHGPVRDISVLSTQKCLIDGVSYNLESGPRWRTLRCTPSDGADLRPHYNVFVAEHCTSNFTEMREAPWLDTKTQADVAIQHQADFFFLGQKAELINSFIDKKFYTESNFFNISSFEKRSQFFTDPFGMFVAFGATTFSPNLVETRDGKFVSEPLDMAQWTTMRGGSALFSNPLRKLYYSIPDGDNFKHFQGVGLLLAPVNYGHWHTQNCPALFALKHLLDLCIIREDEVTVVAPALELANVDILQHYLELLKIKPKIFDPTAEGVDALSFECTLLPSSSSVGEFRWSSYVARALSGLRESSTTQNRVIFISRADVGNQRGLVNEDEVLDALRNSGIPAQRVAARELSYREQRELFAQAILVIGTHGSGLTNAIYGGPQCAVLELICDLLDSNRGWYLNLFHLLGQRYSAINFPSIESEWGSQFRATPELVVSAAQDLLREDGLREDIANGDWRRDPG